jgi:hypothetical protein
MKLPISPAQSQLGEEFGFILKHHSLPSLLIRQPAKPLLAAEMLYRIDWNISKD